MKIKIKRIDLKRKYLSRRNFIKQIAKTSGFAFAGLQFAPFKKSWNPSSLPDKPNLLFILTDQERHTQYFPDGWEETNLPNLTRLKNNGLTFNNAFCNSCMCSPSRSTFLTGLYPAQHLVTDTLPEAEGEPNTQAEIELNPDLPNMAQMLKTAGYNVHYKGKWHVTKPGGNEWTSEDLTAFGFDSWQPPDAGEDLDPENYGGGRANHDGRIAEDASTLLQNINTSQPFALFVSLVNPHDVTAYPDKFDQDYDQSMLTGEIELPPTIDENLENNYKPKAHAELLKKLKTGIGALPTVLHKKRNVNFYGNLVKHVDQEIGKVLDVLYSSRDGQEPVANNTIVFRFADHGEMGLSHGGLRQKMFVTYEEAIRIPMIISNPVLFPNPITSDALVSLVDIMPTVATLSNLPQRENWLFKGTDFSDIINDPSVESVQDEILFTFDDIKAGMEKVDQLVAPPNRIRCIREKDWKYARFFDLDGNVAPEFEMYDLVNDAQEMENLAHPSHPRYNEPNIVLQRNRLKNKLAAMEEEKLAPLVTSVHENHTIQKTTFQLFQNYPNPFNQGTNINFSIEKKGSINLTVFDIQGRKVRTLVNEVKNIGHYSVHWDGTDFSGIKVASGVYVYSLKFGEVLTTRQMVQTK